MKATGLRLAAMALLWLGLAGAVAAKPAEPYSIPLRASVGDRFAITVEKQRVTIRNGKTVKSPSVVSVFDGEVGERLNNGYRIRWTLRETRVRTEQGPVDTPGLAAMFVGVSLEAETDAAGLPVRVHDLPQTLDRVIDGLQKSGVKDEKALDNVRRVFAGMDERTAAATLFKEQVAIALFQNSTLPVGTTRRIPALAANPLGGPPIEMQQNLTLVQVNNNARTARFHFTSQLEPQSLAASMKAVMAKIASSIDDPVRRAELERTMATKLQVNKVTTADAVVSTADGWLRNLTMSEEVSLSNEGDEGSRADTTRITVERVK